MAVPRSRCSLFELVVSEQWSSVTLSDPSMLPGFEAVSRSPFPWTVRHLLRADRAGRHGPARCGAWFGWDVLVSVCRPKGETSINGRDAHGKVLPTRRFTAKKSGKECVVCQRRWLLMPGVRGSGVRQDARRWNVADYVTNAPSLAHVQVGRGRRGGHAVMDAVHDNLAGV